MRGRISFGVQGLTSVNRECFSNHPSRWLSVDSVLEAICRSGPRGVVKTPSWVLCMKIHCLPILFTVLFVQYSLSLYIYVLYCKAFAGV